MSGGNGDGSPLDILVVEDEVTLAEMYRIRLERDGYRVRLQRMVHPACSRPSKRCRICSCSTFSCRDSTVSNSSTSSADERRRRTYPLSSFLTSIRTTCLPVAGNFECSPIS